METADALLTLVAIYLWIGIAVTVAFLAWGVDRIDPSARGASLFRILVAPGVVGLWPLVAVRWLARERCRGSESADAG